MTNPNRIVRNIIGDGRSRSRETYSGNDDITCGKCGADIKAAVLNEYNHCPKCYIYFSEVPFLVNGKKI